MTKRWMVLGVLAAVALAVLAPGLGAPGDGSYTQYGSYILVSYISLSSGRCLSASPPSPRVVLLSCAHAHLVSPALCVIVLAALRDLTDVAILKGALYASVGAPCIWLALSLAGGDNGGGVTPYLLAYNYITALLSVPLSAYVLCGQIVIPSWTKIAETCVTTILPHCIGASLATRARHATSVRVCSLVLLYVECCGSMAEAAGAMHLRDVLITLILETMWLLASAAACYAYARCGLLADEHALAVALAGLPKCDFGVLSHGVWCPRGSHLLPAALAAPLRASMLANMSADADRQLLPRPTLCI